MGCPGIRADSREVQAPGAGGGGGPPAPAGSGRDGETAGPAGPVPTWTMRLQTL